MFLSFSTRFIFIASSSFGSKAKQSKAKQSKAKQSRGDTFLFLSPKVKQLSRNDKTNIKTKMFKTLDSHIDCFLLVYNKIIILGFFFFFRLLIYHFYDYYHFLLFCLFFLFFFYNFFVLSHKKSIETE